MAKRVQSSAIYPPQVLRFGIPSLDQFFTTVDDEHGIEIPSNESRKQSDGTATTSLCIIGADGAGKSVVALHLAAYYAADIARATSRPRVLYISTDLRHSKANGIWRNFGLEWPGRRADALNKAFYGMPTPPQWREDLVPNRAYGRGLTIRLESHNPLEPGDPSDSRSKDLLSALAGTRASDLGGAVDFIDLASTTAGDDWSYINRILALLPYQPRKDAAHLVIIDAVEGLETLVGEFDAYGERRSRRSRISQVMRSAEGKCHVVFIVEESRKDERHPEEFVTDAVMRMRTETVTAGSHSFSRRTLEVEKGRGQQIIRGGHPFRIGDGKGSFSRRVATEELGQTGELTEAIVNEIQKNPNPDDPPVAIKWPDGTWHHMAYFQVLPSLSIWNYRLMQDKSGYPANPDRPDSNIQRGRRPKRLAGFGISHLDDMLDRRKPSVDTGEKTEPEGLPFGTVTALIGENDTLKARLARAFLGQCFRPGNEDQVALMVGLDDSDFRDLHIDLNEVANSGAGRRERSSQPENGRSGSPAYQPETPAMMRERDVESRLVRRRLTAQYSSSAALMNCIARAIGKAKQKLRIVLGKKAAELVAKEDCGKIRMVISNLTTMREVFPEIQSDPLFLPTLVDYLRYQGVTALIIATEPGGPNSGRQSEFCRELRALAQQHICTWHVPFFGEDRVAIAVIPPIRGDRSAVVRELRRKTDEENQVTDNILEVDSHFEMYAGLHEQTTPQLVPLRACLIGQGKGFDRYLSDVANLLSRVFPGSSVVNVASSAWGSEYEMLRAFSYLQGDTRLDATMVMQVDEFWSGENRDRKKLADLTDYMEKDELREEAKLNDPFHLFFENDGTAKRKAGELKQPLTRKWFFRRDSLQWTALKSKGEIEVWERSRKHPNKSEPWNRVPLHWDFGFTLLRAFAWRRAAEKDSVIGYETPVDNEAFGKPMLCEVSDILFALFDGTYSEKSKRKWQEPLGLKSSTRGLAQLRRLKAFANIPFVTWREFLQACSFVAKTESGTDVAHPYAFDIEIMGPETLCCWILEMWASEIRISERIGASWKATVEPKLLFQKAGGTENSFGLLELLSNYPEELFRVFLLLGEIISAQQLGFDFSDFTPRHAQGNAIASRHWYSTACPFMEEHPLDDPLIAAPLPGCYSTRGDWYLAIAQGSRSLQTGCRAIDILCSRRANLARLRNGVGLPVRDFVKEEQSTRAWTRLFRVDPLGAKDYLDYGTVQSLGEGRTDQFGVGDDVTEYPRQWLWRSGIQHYHRNERYFQTIIGRSITLWRSIYDKGFGPNFSKFGASLKNPRNGFEVYDRLLDIGRQVTRSTAAFKEYNEYVEMWKQGLNDSVLRP